MDMVFVCLLVTLCLVICTAGCKCSGCVMVPIGHLVSLTFQQSAHALGQEENQENNFNHF